MCRVCNGDFPTKQEYYDLGNQAKALLDKWSRGGEREVHSISEGEIAQSPVSLPHYINAHFMQRSCMLAQLDKGKCSSPKPCT
jgi:hypothetical protein